MRPGWDHPLLINSLEQAAASSQAMDWEAARLTNACPRLAAVCISCRQESTVLEAHKQPLCRPETGSWASAFAYCRGKCRTSSHSTVHENAYLDTQHHCFSPSGKLPATRQSHPAFMLVPVRCWGCRNAEQLMNSNVLLLPSAS